MTHTLQHYRGLYRGIAPSEHSSIGYGELEIEILEDMLRIKHATGRNVQRHFIPTGHVQKMRKEDVHMHFGDDVCEYKQIDGFTIMNAGIALFFFHQLKPGDRKPMLVVHQPATYINGATFLFGPTQIAQGMFDTLVEELRDKKGNNTLPRITYHGCHMQT